MPLAPGSRVGHYEILSTVGAGGMGVVYAARDTRLGRTVALKSLPDEFKADASRLQRFEQEARAVAALSHPNILAVFDVGAHDGVPYVVTELLEGSTLRALLAAGAVPTRKALEYAAQLAQGLAAAHDKGIVHRDVKPENVFVTREGRVKLLDFGLAKGTETQGFDETLNQTAEGAVLGTAGYMSPEQVRGRPADARSDLFSLGAVLYELLSGRRAFDGATAVERGHAILNAEPPELKVPVAIDRVTRRCLEKVAEQRFQSARDLAFALEALTGASSLDAAAAPAPAARRGSLVVLGLAAGAALGALTALAFQRDRAPPPVSGGSALATNFRRLTRDGAEWPMIAPDGTWFVFSRKVGGTYHLFRQRIGGENAVDLTATSTSDEVAPAISPDGEQIAWQSSQGDGGIFVMGATGESARRVAGFGSEPSWTPDGRLLVSSHLIVSPSVRGGRGDLDAIDPATGVSARIRDAGVDRQQTVWSPDGRHLAYHSKVSNGLRTVVVEEIDGGEQQVVAPCMAWTPRWSADGRALFYGSMQSGTMNLWRVALGADGRVRDPVPVTAGVGVSSEHPSLSRDGRMLLFAATRKYSNVARVPFDPKAMKVTGPVQTITTGAHNYWAPDLSPDGQWVAFADGLAGGREDLVVARADGTERRQLTNDPALDRLPRFTSDSNRVVFYSDRSGKWEVWTIAVDGSDLRKLSEASRDLTFSFPSPTDARVVSNGLGSNGVAILFDASRPFHGQQLVELPAFGEIEPAGWTPDGSEILFENGLVTEQPAGVFAWSPATQRYRQLTPHRIFVSTLRDGRLIGRVRDGHLAVVTLATQHLEVLPVAGAPEYYAKISVSRDGQWIYFAQNEFESDVWLADLPSGKAP